MTASLELTADQRRVIDVLEPLLGAQAVALYEANGRSLHRLAQFARDSSLPCCQRLITSLALAQALLAEELVRVPAFESPRAVADYLKLHFAGQAHESFVVIFLDAQGLALGFEDMFRGSLTQTSVYPREVLKRALHHNAASVIFAHNHPSGSSDPSVADEHLTAALKDALYVIDVRVVDHLVIAGSQLTSFAERGML